MGPAAPAHYADGVPKAVVADVEPLDVTGTVSVTLGTAAWAMAFVVLLLFRSTLAHDDNTDWLWTCLAGIALGIFGIWYCRRRARRLHVSTEDAGAHDVSG